KQSLENFIKNYPAPLSSQAYFLLAAYYNSLASAFDALKDTTNRFGRIKAKEILEKIVRDSSVKNEGWVNSYNLLKEIEKEDFSFELEKVNIPGEPFRALIKYKNIEQLNFRLIKVDENILKLLLRQDEQQWDKLSSASFIKSWQQAFPSTNDLQEHSAEIKIDALPIGRYILLGSSAKSFTAKNNLLGAGSFYVSNISYINKGNEFFVLNRGSGIPLQDASVEVYRQDYYTANAENGRRISGTYRTDKNGYFKLNKIKEEYAQYVINVHFNKDSLFLDDPVFTFYNNYYQDQPAKEKIFFFTDRSIYRPGQTVYFKGIVVKENDNSKSISTGYNTTLFLRNVNAQAVDSIKVRTNEFGSFNARFQLPRSGLNGEYVIAEKDNRNSTSFLVEEYKRAKFYAEFAPLNKSYRVNDSIILTGIAKAYAGNNIDNAKVSYRVVQRRGFIYERPNWGGFLINNETEIAHGLTVTDKDGKFTISFMALPDKKVDKKWNPVFDYQVFADVTDINGETRSAQKNIRAGYRSILLKVMMAERMFLDSFKT
ncbi:MAG TPA: MG2 domain-containing protein, partial [Flavisolibacter sp.]|nr:MG2 domain-containing protein [Flavisolibacter sp.]